jgi:hypothetical protein
MNNKTKRYITEIISKKIGALALNIASGAGGYYLGRQLDSGKGIESERAAVEQNKKATEALQNAESEYKNSLDKPFSPTQIALGKGLLAAGVIGAGAYGLSKASTAVSNRIKFERWLKYGCASITSETEENLCKSYIRNYRLNKLRKEKTLCKDKNCTQNIDKQIQNILLKTD